MDNFLAEGWKSWFKSTSLPLLAVFGRKIHVELSPGKVDSQFYAHYSQCSTKRSLQKLMNNFSSRGVKKRLIQINFFTPLSFWTKITLNFPGKVDSTILRSLQPVQYQAFASKIDGQPFLAEGWKKLIQINFFTPLRFFWTKIHVELPLGKLDSQFLRSLQPVQYQAFASKLMDNFLAEGWKTLSPFSPFLGGWFKSTSLPLSSFLDENSRWTSRESWLTILRSLQPVQYQAFASKIDGQLFLVGKINQLPLLPLSFLDENSRWTSGKVDSQFTPRSLR